jgi:hypothetical protein
MLPSFLLTLRKFSLSLFLYHKKNMEPAKPESSLESWGKGRLFSGGGCEAGERRVSWASFSRCRRCVTVCLVLVIIVKTAKRSVAVSTELRVWVWQGSTLLHQPHLGVSSAAPKENRENKRRTQLSTRCPLTASGCALAFQPGVCSQGRVTADSGQSDEPPFIFSQSIEQTPKCCRNYPAKPLTGSYPLLLPTQPFINSAPLPPVSPLTLFHMPQPGGYF